ncbi:unnamed protein product [marine sediment metagenome]|uniref:HTH cro/C1-type domain-containing protein n=2 Tax=marine sediment metagenome TaxID=412755 RepID=X1KYI6_9ZZZZ
METKIIKTEEQYEKACKKIYELINSQKESIEPNTTKGDEIELLSLLVENYEKENNYKMKAPDPIEAIKFRMDQMNLKHVDVAPLFGGTTRVSEVLNRKRPLSMKTIVLLNRYLQIPFESLMSDSYKFKLNEEAQKKILNISSISNYFKRNRQNKELVI